MIHLVKIIETPSTSPGGGGGTFHGDQAIAAGATTVIAFTLTRATTGTLVFDVWLTSETSVHHSVAKNIQLHIHLVQILYTIK